MLILTTSSSVIKHMTLVGRQSTLPFQTDFNCSKPCICNHLDVFFFYLGPNEEGIGVSDYHLLATSAKKEEIFFALVQRNCNLFVIGQ